MNAPAMITPQQAAGEVLRRRRARRNLVDYARYIEVPGAPVTDDDDTEQFKPVETVLADAAQPIAVSIPHVGWSEQEADDWVAAVWSW